MDFTYLSYCNLIEQLKKNEYQFSDYTNWKTFHKVVILRHDIDISIEAAVKFSELEKEYGVKATYFVLLNTEFYNPASSKSKDMLKLIIENGGDIGLHFDEAYYNKNEVLQKIDKEANILSELLEYPIRSVSMHRPSTQTLEANYDLGERINSYSNEFFKKFKYVSDSRRNWREDINTIIKSSEYSKLHILTHAFWYNEKENTAKETLKNYLYSKKLEIYKSMNENVRDLDEFLNESEALII